MKKQVTPLCFTNPLRFLSVATDAKRISVLLNHQSEKEFLFRHQVRFLQYVLGCLLVFLLNPAGKSLAQGPDCATAELAQVSLPYNSPPAETTCFMFNDYSDKNMSETCNSAANPNTPLFTRGADKIYAFTPAESGGILITLTCSSPGDTASSLFLFSDCPDAGSCLASNIGNTTVKNLGVTVQAGLTYYLMVDRAILNITDTCILSYTLSISSPDPYCPKFVTSTGNSVPNLDFESGKFTNWEGYTGTCCEINTPTKGITNDRHTITKGKDTDPYSEEILVVAPGGGKYSARLGNSNVNAQAEKLSYKFKVTDKSNVLLYKYAIVLQDGGHDASQQPRFEIKVLDNQKKVIKCGQYRVVVNANTPCFKTSPSDGTVYYREWTTVGVDLSKYIGQTVTVEYATGDCSGGAHFGYAYLDVAATKLQIQTEGSGGCEGQGTVKLIAPPGFAHYSWTGPGITKADTFQVVEVTPSAGATYNVQLASVADKTCLTPLSITLTPSSIKADFIANEVCEGDVTTFTDSSTVQGDGALVGALFWDFGDGETSTTINPIHRYEKAGTYTAKLIAKNNMGCKDSIVKTIVVNPALASPVVSCAKQTLSGVEFSWLAVPGAVGYEVSLDNGEIWFPPSSGFSAGSITHVINGLSHGESLTLMVRTRALGTCKESIPDTITCMFDSDCKFYFNLPNAFSPNGDLNNDVFKADGNCITSYTLKIVNRWGQLVFSTQNIDEGWNGGWNNNLNFRQPVGAYIYVAAIRNAEGDVMKRASTVALTE